MFEVLTALFRSIQSPRDTPVTRLVADFSKERSAFVGMSVYGPCNKQTHCLLSTIFLLYYYQLITTKYRHRVSVIAFHSVHLQGTLTLEDEGITSLTSEGTQHRSIISQKTQLLSGLAIHQHVGKAETPEVGAHLPHGVRQMSW